MIYDNAVCPYRQTGTPSSLPSWHVRREWGVFYRRDENPKVTLKQTEKEYENAQKQVTVLEEEAVKALTGESALDLSIINTMIIKHRAKRDAAAQTIH